VVWYTKNPNDADKHAAGFTFMQNALQGSWYVHNLDPIALEIGDAQLPWYWLVYLFGWVGAAWSLKASRRLMNQPASPAAVNDILFWGWLGVIIGGRLGYVVAYNLAYYWERPTEVFALWNGGMSFHGGFLGLAVACAYVARKHKMPIVSLTDPLALTLPWFLGLGRLANFVNGELPGRASTLPWAVIFPSPFDDTPRHPSQIYEAFSEGFLLGALLWVFKRPLLKKPGLTTVAFTTGYAVFRFLVEFTREPDAQLGLIAGLSMGQWLCLGMLAVIGGYSYKSM
jgi:phosphatidylglycerol:prolipoprotein diacylglycerol transferase